ncbi:hypothetical protein PORY_000886 [Pneumocystis oryctolagi]|uniref:Uncharacterized protein n=1 Tax=Pneumocystis oryctolagi TaxID=42067 RepID=A0ACB7CE85_9ASCO|nr:hypothetical protein PORY_000886 [Pneumocystis oryctolagi]
MENLEDNNPFFEESYECKRHFFQNSKSDFVLEKGKETSTEIDTEKSKDLICCHIYSIMHNSSEEPFIFITDTEKVSENSSKHFTVYIIRMKGFEVRRRYSEFESLRVSLSRLFPTAIVPPIPEKSNMYLPVSSARAKKHENIINQRKRMLQVFLNRCAFHPILNKSHVFHCFLDENISWQQVLISPPISLLPQNILMASPLNPYSCTNDPTYQCLPIPSSNAKLINPNNKNEIKFFELENKIKKIEEIIRNDIEKVNKSIIKNIQGLADNYSELGAVYNAFSLTEPSPLASKIESFGQANDLNFHSNCELIENLNFILSEPLKELAQFHEIARSRLIYKRQKALQYEIIVDILNQNKNVLDTLEKSEIEAQKIESSLARLNTSVSSSSALNSDECTEQDKEQLKKTKYSLFERFTTAMKDMIDTDSTSSRKKSIEKIYEKISLLENALKVTKKDASIAAEAITEELKRFQDIVRKDYCELMINVGKCYIEWAKKNIKIWEDIDCSI